MVRPMVDDKPLTWDNVREFLPTMDAAEVKLDADLEKVQSQKDVETAFAAYYAVVEEGIKALHEDTKDRNSLTTLQSVFRENNRFSSVLRHFMEGKKKNR